MTKIPVIKGLPPNLGFNLESQEKFVKDKGVIFEHWICIPSVIGQKDRGDYRRPDSLDTVSSNGMLYKKAGEFIAVLVNNGKSERDIDGGLLDMSQARLILPKFYSTRCDGKIDAEISLLPGDRVYVKNCELRVPNYQKMEFNPTGVDYAQFPIKHVEFIMDSRGIEYSQGTHFKITDDGDINWIPGKNNPGTDEDTGKGRMYSIRYQYLAFWYIERLLNEIRITNTEDATSPVRLPLQALIVREYVYHNKTKGDNETKKDENRANPGVKDSIEPDRHPVKVSLKNFE